jgi:hypothetical protein
MNVRSMLRRVRNQEKWDWVNASGVGGLTRSDDDSDVVAAMRVNLHRAAFGRAATRRVG